jgi:hypothetical protein
MKVSKYRYFASILNTFIFTVALFGAKTEGRQTLILVGWLVIEKTIEKIFSEYHEF